LVKVMVRVSVAMPEIPLIATSRARPFYRQNDARNKKGCSREQPFHCRTAFRLLTG